MYFIGIDIGTTNTKLCLFSAPDFKCRYKYSFSTPKENIGNESNFKIEDIISGIKKGLEDIVSKVKYPDSIINISIASVGEAGVIIDKNGKTIGPCITWYDKRTMPQLREISNIVSVRDIYDITGIPAHSNYSLTKILWLKENCPQKAHEFYKWLCIAEYVAFKMTGEIKSEYSLASRTMAFDINKKKWSSKMVSTLKSKEDIFPDAVESGKEIGTILKSFSEQTGLSSKTTVSIGGHDHMCGSIAAESYSEDSLLDSTGTTEGVLALSDKPVTNQKFFSAFLSNGIYVIQNLYTIFASLPSAGLAIEWYVKNFMNNNESIDSITEELYKNSSTFSHNIIFIPHLRGSGPPYRNPDSRCLIYGINEKSTRLDELYAIFEGLCYELKNLIETMEQLAHKKYGSVKVIGSACRNPFWLQLKADILNKMIISYDIDEAVAKGAAILSAYKNGYIDDLNIHEKCKIFKPNEKMAVKYKYIYEDEYLPLYNAKKAFENNEAKGVNC